MCVCLGSGSLEAAVESALAAEIPTIAGRTISVVQESAGASRAVVQVQRLMEHVVLVLQVLCVALLIS